ncbi:ABC transporter ATP-binding protein [Atopobacter sp. AH10]|uniref:ABC transporter ATP-binding protein n=1 Tax=Atopobacter sp. AH10 TaxID=2315861 RepID=UPI000EF193F4|nr:ABC transporter ATP-binding protein [Atopobacter sp. AH10]RLK62867.1 ABC transporter ATP-binding protein [Atopobacter sp. AH10]
MTRISLEHLKKSFGKGQELFQAVKDISLKVHSGEIVALLGPNGAGKTTTVQMIAGLLTPDAGEIYIDDEKLNEQSRKEHRIGLVLGGELGFYGNASAEENLHFFARLNQLSKQERISEVDRVLGLVELKDVRQKKVREFSRGMRQRLHIARALLGRPDVLLLDEPTSGLDVEISRNIRLIIRRLTDEEQIPVLLTSHTMTEVEALADRVVLIGAGEVFHEGDIDSIVRLSQVSHIDRPATLEESYLALAPKLRRK